jgi:hypothetical protein
MCLSVFDLFLSLYFANMLNDDVSCLDIELKLILEKLLVCIMLFRLFLLQTLVKIREFRISFRALILQ